MLVRLIHPGAAYVRRGDYHISAVCLSKIYPILQIHLLRRIQALDAVTDIHKNLRDLENTCYRELHIHKLWY